ncbi:MAG TPA: aminomethyl-transferring glycine dehydrogenase subunit GcvPB [Pseudomonadales bacterium]|nr:aminomethyl-transferring glycine dehydrogenase subunit GcvPB [Pseudomonadales bacterium]
MSSTERDPIATSGQTLFDLSAPGRTARAQMLPEPPPADDIPQELRRRTRAPLPEVSELQVVRHFTNLSRKNFAIDSQFYPLGSCTMKYNPRGAHKAASLPGFLGRHPLAPETLSQGILSVFFDLQNILQDVTGMRGVSLTPMAGAQGEFAGVAMIRAYHEARGDHERQEIIVPEAAHGTNPATAVMCGYRVREVKVDKDGDVDLDDLKAAVGPQTAGLMMTNPSTCGVFERKIGAISEAVHGAGGLLYYDGANLNAILGKVRPGDMGFDVLHMNLHKTFATPHGGGGPGAGPVGVGERLLPHLPTPIVVREERDGAPWYRWKDADELPGSIGHLSAFMGNAGILVRALAYALMLGREGMYRVGDYSTLNANYLARRLAAEGFQLAYPRRRATHEFIVTFAKMAKERDISAMDLAKRLLDYGIHAPTTYFPLLVPECWLIEPTETETKEELDAFVDAMLAIRKEAETTPELVKDAPSTMPVKRLDDVRAARQLDLVWQAAAGQD